MSLYADILRAEHADDDDLAVDDGVGTWTVTAWELDGQHIPGVPNKELALAIVRAIRFGYGKGLATASYS